MVQAGRLRAWVISMKTRKGFFLLGMVTMLLWASYIPHLIPLPFSLRPSLQKIARDLAEAPESLKEKSGVIGKGQAEIEGVLMRKVMVIWLIKAIPILIGLLSGFFLLRRKFNGRIMAIFVAISWIVLNALTYVRSGDIWDRVYMTYVTMLQERPIYTFHNDILPVFIFSFTLFYLMRPSIAREFKEGGKKRKGKK